MKPRVKVTRQQRLEAARVLIEHTKTTTLTKLAAELGKSVFPCHLSTARSYPIGAGQPCPGWVVEKILELVRGP